MHRFGVVDDVKIEGGSLMFAVTFETKVHGVLEKVHEEIVAARDDITLVPVNRLRVVVHGVLEQVHEEIVAARDDATLVPVNRLRVVEGACCSCLMIAVLRISLMIAVSVLTGCRHLLWIMPTPPTPPHLTPPQPNSTTQHPTPP